MAAMQPVIHSADVVMFGALDPDGEVFHKCSLLLNGNPASVVLYVPHADGERKQMVDRLANATVTENNDGTLTIEGESQELIHTVEVESANSRVRWEVYPKGCGTCK